MKTRKAVISGALICALTLGAASASAQWRGPHPVQPSGQMGDLLMLVEQQTGLSTIEIMTQLRSGTTLATLIEANGGDTDEVIAAAVEAAINRIQGVAAAGRITQEQADALIAQVEAHVTAVVNSTHTPLLRQMQLNSRAAQRMFGARNGQRP
ncbi:MAG: hypothetical protein ACUVSX_03800 [Aggregatilineales bacterium]